MKIGKAGYMRAVKTLAVVCLCAVLLLGTAAPASAMDGSLTVKVDDTRLLQELAAGAKVTVALYKIAGRTGTDKDYKWQFVDEAGLTTPFAGLADRIEAYETAIRNDRTPDTSLLTVLEALIQSGVARPVEMGAFSSTGRVFFDDLPEGLYFFMMTSGPKLLKVKSAIVPVPFVFKGAVLYKGIETTAKVEWSTTPPVPPPPSPPPYTPPVNPNPPINPPANPPQQNEIIIEDYDTPLGIAIEFNHVGDCYE